MKRPEPAAGSDLPGIGPRPTSTLPADLQAFADAIVVVQQRIQRLIGTDADHVALSRELRRATEAGRRDLTKGRARLLLLAAEISEAETRQQ